ncbi:hypothetical protein VCHC02A1_1061, partial [Vibrio cholerae HC-02A1]
MHLATNSLSYLKPASAGFFLP